jgi:hydroxyethylthiazole kinase-like uncharacterized protein yjeF
VALAMPEARVLGLTETDAGGFELEAIGRLDPLADRVSAVLIGPGMQDEAATAELVHALLPRLGDMPASVVLDACAMGALLHGEAGPTGARFAHPLVLTPHAGEMAHLTGVSKAAVCADPSPLAVQCAQRWNAIVALKGAVTHVAAPDGAVWRHEGGNVGLAVSGSGDVLAGIIAGCAARGATLAQATCWGVALHARAGERLAARYGTLGYLARELCNEIPVLLDMIAGRKAGAAKTTRPAPGEHAPGDIT